LTSVSQTNRHLQHKCRRIFIRHSILVITISHQWKSVAQMLHIFHYILFSSNYNVSPMEISGRNVTEFSSYIVY
jgi:hypothetical protein